MAVAVVFTAVLVVYSGTDEFKNWLVNTVESLGVFGPVLLVGIFWLQILIAVIPGEPIEIIAGVMYGTFGGMVLCLFAIVTASGFIFYMVRKLGVNKLEKWHIYQKVMEYPILKEKKKLENMIFLLYLIPGTPKDVLVYVCSLTDISFWKFILISTVARIPSVVTSTMVGASLVNGELWLSIMIFTATSILGIGGIYYQNKKMLKDR